MNIQRCSTATGLPDDEQLESWLECAMQLLDAEGEVGLRIVDETESAELNQRYREKQGATNVLSFPALRPDNLPPELEDEYACELGDMIICAPVVAREAAEQDKPLVAHWAHMLVHGLLHLLGHDHLEPLQARKMEALEIEILQQMGYPDPYSDT